MPLSAGSMLGPYEVLSLLGTGGMGEVYRARDPRLGRDVAIKVLPPTVGSDPERLQRFEQEARASAALNHPNILVVYDIGTDAGTIFIVSELLDGRTVRELLADGPLPARKAIEYATQIAHGLAAAHDRGIVHRDLKPENLFVTRDGRVKILDFGVAKLVDPAGELAGATVAPTIAHGTAPGVVLGTVGYMAPEQVRGESADGRTDLFALGTVLFEMLTGRRAFSGDSAVETMAAILRTDPLELPDVARIVSPGLQRIVRHCLEKSREERFQSARDLAFDLAALSQPSGTVAEAGVAAASKPRRGALAAIAGLVVLAAVTTAAFVLGQRTAVRDQPTFAALTFRRGTVVSARFTGDGRTILYGALWGNAPVDVFSTRPGSAESRSLGLPAGADILAVSPQGELAVGLRRRFIGGFIWTGTLARVGLAGGAPRELLDDVQIADWTPGGDLAIVREVSGRSRLECPAGTVLYESGGWIRDVRVSPRGDRIAFIDHQIHGDDAGTIAVIDFKGNKQELAGGWISATGLAWSGDEVWFTATKAGNARALFAVSLSGRVRLLLRAAGVLTLHDVSASGQVLLTRDESRLGIATRRVGDAHEQDVSWLDWSLIRDLRDDGTLLFDETGEGGGKDFSVYLRRVSDPAAVKLGDGIAMALSPDGRQALSIQHRAALVLLPTGPGQPVPVPLERMLVQRAAFFPDGKRLLVLGNEPGHGIRMFVQPLGGGAPRPFGPEGVSASRIAISPDGRVAAARGPDGQMSLFPVDGGEPRVLKTVEPQETVIGWNPDGRSIRVVSRGRLPLSIYSVDVDSGRRTVLQEITDGAGTEGFGVLAIIMSPDGRRYAYTYDHFDSTLYLVDGLR